MKFRPAAPLPIFRRRIFSFLSARWRIKQSTRLQIHCDLHRADENIRWGIAWPAQNMTSALHRDREISMRRLNGANASDAKDFIAAEEPLEIRVEGHSVAVVMRTPGEDRELAAGFLVTEGLVHAASDLVEIRHHSHCLLPGRNGDGRLKEENEAAHSEEDSRPGLETNFSGGNVINVRLRNPETFDLKKLTRHVFTSSSCGICSKASIEAVRQQFPPIEDSCEVEPQVLLGLPESIATAQETFKRTGGLHPCALFDLTGKLLVLPEDLG